MNNSALNQSIELHKNKHFDEFHQIVNNASSITNWRFIILMSLGSISWIVTNIIAVKYWQFSLYPIVVLNMLLYWVAACFASPIAYSETKSAQKKREYNKLLNRGLTQVRF